MSAIGITCSRTLGYARNMVTTAFVAAGFISVTAAMFAFNLDAAEGGGMTLAAVWAVSAAPVLPILAALLSMGVWSDERLTGRMDVLLATAVRERELVAGKFLGVLTQLVLLVLLSLISTVCWLWIFAPSAMAGVRLLSFLPALIGLLLQGLLWCAISVAASAMCTHAAAAAVLAIMLTVALPRLGWLGMMAWSGKGRTAFGEMPLDANIFDMATGVIPLDDVACYLVSAWLSLFIAAKYIASLRLTGRRVTGLRVSTAVAVMLALVLTALTALAAAQWEFIIDIPVSGPSATLSPRTRGVLAESGGSVSVTCFLPRKDARFRSVSRFLRLLKRESEAVGGARVDLQYVDPRWDIGAAERLVRNGVAEDSLVFEKGRRMVEVPLRDGCGERVCASAIARLATVPRRRNVYWTVGHGEVRFDEYGVFGMSDIARDLSRDGYHNQPLDLATAAQIPGDCALIVVAGAKTAFSRAELGRLDVYLREGGRLLVLLGSAQEEGVASILPGWGIRVGNGSVVGAPTLSGTDVIVSGFSDHPIAAPLRGARVILDRPVAFTPSAAVETAAGAARLEFTPLATSGATVLAVAVERGAGAGGDLAIRPTRIVAVGDCGFVLNGQLAARANANRDFFLNCAAYLAGAEVAGAQGDEANLLSTGMDRAARMRHAIGSAAALPSAVFMVMALVAVRRRRRTG